MTEPFTASLVPFEAEDFLWVTFKGEMSLSRLTRAHEAFMAHPTFHPGIDELLDFSQTTLRHTSAEDAKLIRQYVIAKPESLANKSVWVVNTQLEYGLGRMIAGMLGKDVHIERQICFSNSDALEWLRPGKAASLLADFQKAEPIELV